MHPKSSLVSDPVPRSDDGALLLALQAQAMRAAILSHLSDCAGAHDVGDLAVALNGTPLFVAGICEALVADGALRRDGVEYRLAEQSA
ncbi:MAG: hypothetical protein K2X97_20525 [Mycobacteriaceae bacterium]|nr:hypothetical protein [Mycobacteriaceae bacterium]